MQQTIELEPLMTFKEVMKYLRVARSTLVRMMESGEVPAHKVGSHWRFYPSEVKAVVKPTEIVRIVEQGEFTPETFYQAERGQVTPEQGEV